MFWRAYVDRREYVGTIDRNRIGLETYRSSESRTKCKSIPVCRGHSKADGRGPGKRHTTLGHEDTGKKERNTRLSARAPARKKTPRERPRNNLAAPEFAAVLAAMRDGADAGSADLLALSNASVAHVLAALAHAPAATPSTKIALYQRGRVGNGRENTHEARAFVSEGCNSLSLRSVLGARLVAVQNAFGVFDRRAEKPSTGRGVRGISIVTKSETVETTRDPDLLRYTCQTRIDTVCWGQARARRPTREVCCGSAPSAA